MPDITMTLEQLRILIGRQVQHHGIGCQIIEVLEDGPALILQDSEMHRGVQADQFGEAHRLVVETYTVSVFIADGSAYHPDFVLLPTFPLLLFYSNILNNTIQMDNQLSNFIGVLLNVPALMMNMKALFSLGNVNFFLTVFISILAITWWIMKIYLINLQIRKRKEDK